MRLTDGNSESETPSVCPTTGPVYTLGHRPTQRRMYDSARESSGSVQQTAAGSCSTTTSLPACGLLENNYALHQAVKHFN